MSGDAADNSAPDPGTQAPPADEGWVSGLLFLLSMATLALQIVQVRVFSYSINPVYVYMVISLAMLGIGASGTALSLLPSLRTVPLARALSLCLLGFAVTGAVANAAFAQLSGFVVAKTGLTLLSPVTGIFALFVLPYFFSGMGVALVLVSDPGKLSRNYFINLVGSGAGCFAVYPFLGPLGAEWVVLAILAVCAVAGAAGWLRHAERARAAAVACAVLLVVATFFAERVLPYQPDQSDFYQQIVDAFGKEAGHPVEPTRRFARWDPVGRVEIFEFPDPFGRFSGDVPALFFAQDAGAPSNLLAAGAHPRVKTMLAEASLYGLAAQLRPGGDVLVMGLGGGPDLIATLGAGAAQVTGVEINEAVIDAIGGPFRDFLGLPPESSDRLVLAHSDGRAFARRFEGRFDVIQMTGADTYAAGSVSGSILSENYLYTLEAFGDYFGALKDDGILAVTRFGFEPFKIVSTAAMALMERGVTAPGDHVIVVEQGAIWTLVLVKKTPFTASEIEYVRAFADAAERGGADFSLPAYDAKGFSLKRPLRVTFDPGQPKSAGPNLYAGLLMAAEKGRLETRLAAVRGFDFTPSTDDRPFFLQLDRFEWPGLSDLFARNEIENPLVWSIHSYLSIVVQIGLLALVLILGPLLVLRSRGTRMVAAAPVALYFFAIGAGFMFIEIGLMQRFSLFLGHPNFSISTVLFTLLVFSGLGSLVSGLLRVGLHARLGAAIAAIIAGVFLFSVTSGPVFAAFLDASIGVRIAVAVAVLAPMAFFMGMPLPNVLRLTEERFPEVAPWALGVNGFASVMGSLATIPLTVALGFSATFQLGAVCYGVAWLAFLVIVRVRAAGA